MSDRRAGAPRLIEWTGERCVPWTPDVQVVYEHFHRYLWARRLVGGARVLDLGSGEGFGAALLAGAAESVLGIDIDGQTVEHSRLNYSRSNLEFREASATDLGELADDSFGAVVTFEVIEHLGEAEQETLLAEAARVLAPGGLLITSTPERRSYSEATGQKNPFHLHELTEEELTGLLGRHFAFHTLFAQRTATGSRIESLPPASNGRHLAVRIERAGEGWREAAPAAPLYLLAVASDQELPVLPSDSTLSDFSLELVRQAERARDSITVSADQLRADLEAVEAQFAQVGRELEATKAAADARAEQLSTRAWRAEQREAEERHAARRASDAAREARDNATAERYGLGAELTARTRELDEARSRIAAAEGRLARFEGSVTWQLFQRVRNGLYGRIGEGSLLGRAVGAALRALGRRSGTVGGAGPRQWLPISLPTFPAPEVTLVIPVHDSPELTERCLRAILHSTDEITYEVVVVDDTADLETKALLEVVDGIRTIVNEENLGFLRTINRGASVARGRFLVLMNNDTEPQRGWLRTLVDRAESSDDIGIVTPKFVFPDGGLLEAGGIVWREGVAYNYGRGSNAAAPEFNYVRDVDYGSAAALLVRSEVWEATGGFDERYIPIYWEDTDLCFAARELGWRVVYEPKAVVIHAEGSSMGTDVTSGGKRHQARNQPEFVKKWRQQLNKQPSGASPESAYAASDRNHGPHVLVIDHHVPLPDRDSGSVRMWHLLEGLLSLGCRVSFLPDNGQPVEPHTSELQGLGVEVLVGEFELSQRLAGLRDRLAMVVASRPYVAARYMHVIREHSPDALLAYDTVDLHFLREQRRDHKVGGSAGQVADGFRELELALMRSSDVTLVVSDEDRRHLIEVIPDLELETVPNANRVASEVPGPEDRAGLIFVGCYQHLPNADAAIYLAREIMPRLWRQRGDVRLTLVGSLLTPEVEALASDRIEVAGWVEDLQPMLRGSIAMAAPLRYGAGMKGKITQSLAAGLPVVTSTIGAEGLHATDGLDLQIADDPDEFVERVLLLMRDRDAWRSQSAEGLALAERIFSPAVQRDALERLLERARGARPVERVMG
jgi:O-antigen biosynthesis protein